MFYGIIYLLTNVQNGKQYVGQTKHGLEQRFKQHCKRRGNNCVYLQAAIAKYGSAAFTKEVLFVGFDLQSLNAAEAQLIADYETLSPNGYNIRSGGDQAAIHPDTRAKLSAIASRRVHTEEYKARMSLACMDTIRTEEHKMKISIANKGRPKSPEHRAKISAAMRNRRR